VVNNSSSSSDDPNRPPPPHPGAGWGGGGGWTPARSRGRPAPARARAPPPARRRRLTSRRRPRTHRRSLESRGVMNYIVVMRTAAEIGNWRLCRAGEAKWTGGFSSALLEGWDDLDEIERGLGIMPGQLFLLRPDGTADHAVIAYFASPTFRRLARDTRDSYTKDLKVFLS